MATGWIKVFLIWIFLIWSFAGVAAAQNPAATVSVTRWPEDRSAAISLSFDDGINSHLDHVGPILRKHHLNATFFVTTSMGPWEKRKTEWKQLAAEGNELGNHTVHHPCMSPQISPHLQDYTPEMMEAEIRDAAHEIQDATHTQRGLTFAYPCGDMTFGKAEDADKNAALYLRFVSEYAFGARSVTQGVMDPADVNPMVVHDV